jgi:hypothetical protein
VTIASGLAVIGIHRRRLHNQSVGGEFGRFVLKSPLNGSIRNINDQFQLIEAIAAMPWIWHAAARAEALPCAWIQGVN